MTVVAFWYMRARDGRADVASLVKREVLPVAEQLRAVAAAHAKQEDRITQLEITQATLVEQAKSQAEWRDVLMEQIKEISSDVKALLKGARDQ